MQKAVTCCLQMVLFLAHIFIVSEQTYKGFSSGETFKHYLEASNPSLLTCGAVPRNEKIPKLWEPVPAMNCACEPCMFCDPEDCSGIAGHQNSRS